MNRFVLDKQMASLAKFGELERPVRHNDMAAQDYAKRALILQEQELLFGALAPLNAHDS